MRMHTLKRPGTHTHARTRNYAHTDQYVILIAFPQQQWFRKRASLLRYTYIACLVPIDYHGYENCCLVTHKLEVESEGICKAECDKCISKKVVL
jgi:hypothetical protein